MLEVRGFYRRYRSKCGALLCIVDTEVLSAIQVGKRYNYDEKEVYELSSYHCRAGILHDLEKFGMVCRVCEVLELLGKCPAGLECVVRFADV